MISFLWFYDLPKVNKRTWAEVLLTTAWHYTSQRPQTDAQFQRSLESLLGSEFWTSCLKIYYLTSDASACACLCVNACLLTLWKDTDYVFSPPLGNKPALTKQTRWTAPRERFVFNSELITHSLSVPLVSSSLDYAGVRTQYFLSLIIYKQCWEITN